MSALSRLTCRAFVESQSAEHQKRLLASLSMKQRASFEHLPSVPSGFFNKNLSTDPLLDRVHVSWLKPYIQSKSTTEHLFYLACLKPEQAAGLQQFLQISKKLPSLSAQGKNFLRKDLLSYLEKEDPHLLPTDLIPHSSLLPLTQLNISQLLQLIDLLGLRDLSHEMGLIIDKKKLLEIESCLKPQELKLVRGWANKKEHFAFPRIEINRWDGQAASLRRILQQRGINRLAKACYDEHPSFLWVISHTLDTSRGMLFSKLCGVSPSAGVQEALRKQVLELMVHISPSYPIRRS